MKIKILIFKKRFQLIVAIVLIVVGFLYFLFACNVKEYYCLKLTFLKKQEKPYDPVQNPQNDVANKAYKKAMSLNSNEPSIK